MTELEKIKTDPTSETDFNKLIEEMRQRNKEWYTAMVEAVFKKEEFDTAIMCAPGMDTAVILSKIISEMQFAMQALPLAAAALEVNRAHMMAQLSQLPGSEEAHKTAVDILSGNSIFISGRKRVKIDRGEDDDDGE